MLEKRNFNKQQDLGPAYNVEDLLQKKLFCSNIVKIFSDLLLQN